MVSPPIKKLEMAAIEMVDHLAYEYEMVRKHAADRGGEVAHWTMTPEDWLYAAGYIHNYNQRRMERLMAKKPKKGQQNRVRDYGADGMARRVMEDGSVVYDILQAKYYTSKQVNATDIGSFLFSMMRLSQKHPMSKGWLYTATKLQIELREDIMLPNHPMKHVLHPWKKAEEAAAAAAATEIVPENLLPPRPYQTEIIQGLMAQEGIAGLQLPCRMGKTLIAGHALAHHHPPLIVAMAPLKISVHALLDRLTVFLPGYAALLVDSDVDGTTAVEDIRVFLERTGPKVIYTTFDSAEVVAELITEEDMEDAYVIGDEVHNMTAATLAIVKRFPRGLMMSATLPDEVCHALEIEEVWTVSLADAIAGGWVCDYQIWLPHLRTLQDGTTEVEVGAMPQEMTAIEDASLAAKAMYLAVVMLRTGARRCIAYLSTQEECRAFLSAVRAALEGYHGLDVWTGQIDSTVPQGKRNELLRDFQYANPDSVFHVMASVRVLDEAVDLPRCDSVFIANVAERCNVIRMMQRAMRGATLDRKKPSKKAQVILWATGWEQCVDALELVKEADPAWRKKFRVAAVEYERQGRREWEEMEKVAVEDLERWAEIACVSPWEAKLRDLKEFVRENGRLPRQTEGTLGIWISNQRRRKRTLTKERMAALESLPKWSWGVVRDTPVVEWSVQLEALREFINKEKRYPKAAEVLGTWINTQRQNKRKGSLAEERIAALELLPQWSWGEARKTPVLKWSVQLEALQKFIKKEGRLPKKSEALRSWINTQRRRKGTLSAERVAALEALPQWSWGEVRDAPHIDWSVHLEELREFIKKQGQLPKQPGVLRKWVSHQRTAKKNGKLSEERIAALELLPQWSWGEARDAPLVDWSVRLEELREFIKKEKRYPKSNEGTLGTWIDTQRQNKRKGVLSEERVVALEALPQWSWGEARETPVVDWSVHLEGLREFIKKEQRLPKQLEVLGSWVNTQRQSKRKGILSAERIAALEALPQWSWGKIMNNVEVLS
jgi:superfamily II DNA or RNA helicase